MTYEALRSVQPVRRVCGIRTDPVCGCFDNAGGLNYGYLPSRHGSRVRELANGLRLGAVVLSQNLSGV
jgi:hypothetical protein